MIEPEYFVTCADGRVTWHQDADPADEDLDAKWCVCGGPHRVVIPPPLGGTDNE
jgi:hypothetical protein